MTTQSGTEAALSAIAARLDAIENDVRIIREMTESVRDQSLLMAELLRRARRTSSYTAAYTQRPLVSVRLGYFRDHEALCKRAIPSILNQTYDNFEVLIVADGIDSDAETRLAQFDDPRIRYFSRPQNGPYPSDSAASWLVAGSHAFNEAVAHASGAWIAPIDQDDEWTTDHLRVLLSRALDSGAELTYGIGRAHVEDVGDTTFGTWPPAQGDFGFQCAIYHAALAFFSYAADSYLLQRPADWDMLQRMCVAGVRLDFVDRVVTNYYVPRTARSFRWWVERARARPALN
ncbi:MAG TPA: glycosyltransferase family A protein [Solirubrobacteraceae bacterium]|nr:glycosyltransferase family A protein [Solirubrobacteraceae bacterium]